MSSRLKGDLQHEAHIVGALEFPDEHSHISCIDAQLFAKHRAETFSGFAIVHGLFATLLVEKINVAGCRHNKVLPPQVLLGTYCVRILRVPITTLTLLAVPNGSLTSVG